MSAINAKASRKMKKYAVLTREPRCFLGSLAFSWEQRKWINTVDISTNMVDPKSGKYDLLPHVAPGNIESFTGRLYDNVKLVGEENLISGKFVFNVGDIVYGKINPQLGKYVFARFSGLTSADAYVLNAKNGIVQKFLYAVIQTRDFYDYSVSVSKRSGMPKINRDELNAYSYWAPSESEQLKIGEYLLTLDHLITLHQRQPFLHSPPDISLIVQLTPPFYTFSWEQRKLEDYLTVSAEKNTGNIYGRSDVLSVSGDYGIVNQIEFQGRSFAGASVSNYGVVQTGDVVYTKSPLNSNPYGIIKTNKGKPGIVSTLYAVYHPKENAFSDFIQVYFEQHARMNNYMHPLVNKGAKNDMKVSAENALKGPVCFPSRIEQESISAFFSVLDNLITLHQRELEKLQNIKKSMLEKMFV